MNQKITDGGKKDGRNFRIWAQEHNARISVNVPLSLMVIEATMVKIEELEKKIPILLAQKIHEDVDLSTLARLTSFNRSCIPTISRLTGTYIAPVGEDNIVCFDLF